MTRGDPHHGHPPEKIRKVTGKHENSTNRSYGKKTHEKTRVNVKNEERGGAFHFAVSQPALAACAIAVKALECRTQGQARKN
jgi:hypothetical protein